MRISRIVFGFVLAGLLSGISYAGTIIPIITSPGGLQQWSDNSGDFLFDRSLVPNRTVDVGDVLLGQFSINTVEFQPSGATVQTGLTSGNNEFTGAFAIEVATKIGGGGSAALYSFVPTTAAARAAISATFPTVIGPEILSWTADTMAALYDGGATIDYTRIAGTLESSFATAINGTQLSQLGHLGLPGEGWVANSVDDNIDVIGMAPPPGIGGSFNLAVNAIPGTVDPSLVFGSVLSSFGGTVNLNGSGSLLATGGLTTPYDSFNNVDFVTNVSAIPEPASLAVWAGFAGLVVLRTRRRKAVA